MQEVYLTASHLLQAAVVDLTVSVAHRAVQHNRQRFQYLTLLDVEHQRFISLCLPDAVLRVPRLRPVGQHTHSCCIQPCRRAHALGAVKPATCHFLSTSAAATLRHPIACKYLQCTCACLCRPVCSVRSICMCLQPLSVGRSCMAMATHTKHDATASSGEQACMFMMTSFSSTTCSLDY